MEHKEKCEMGLEEHKWVKQPDKTFVCKMCGLWIKNKQTTIQISINTKKKLMNCDQYMTKEYPTHEDRVLWLMERVSAYFKL